MSLEEDPVSAANEAPAVEGPTALPVARSSTKPYTSWKVWLSIVSVIVGVCVVCVGGSIGYGLFLDYKSTQ